MEQIGQLFDQFAAAYQHSLYAIGREQEKVETERRAAGEQLKRQHERQRSRTAARTADGLMARMHRAKDAYESLTAPDSSVLKTAEYLAYGSAVPQNIRPFLSSDTAIPWIMPFLGHKNLLIESSGDACQVLGVQFLLRALMQTAPGQLSAVVINPELRAEFSVCSNLPDFRMLTKPAEIQNELSALTEQIIQTDQLLHGNYPSLVALRRAAQQPVGRLMLLIVQDLPQERNEDTAAELIKISRGAPRAGIAVLYLNSKAPQKKDSVSGQLKRIGNFFVLTQTENGWQSGDANFEGLIFSFSLLKNRELSEKISEISKNPKISRQLPSLFPR